MKSIKTFFSYLTRAAAIIAKTAKHSDKSDRYRSARWALFMLLYFASGANNQRSHQRAFQPGFSLRTTGDVRQTDRRIFHSKSRNSGNDRIPHHTCRLPHACVYQPACCIPDFCPAYDKTYHDPQSALWHTPISAGSADGSRDISAVSQNGNLPRRNGRKTLHHNRKTEEAGAGHKEQIGMPFTEIPLLTPAVEFIECPAGFAALIR